MSDAGQADARGLPLTLALQPAIAVELARLAQGSAEHCLSDHAFSNLYLFREAHDYRFQHGELACVSGVTYDGTRHLMPLFDIGGVPVDDLRARLEGHDCYYPVAPRHAQRLDLDQVRITESRDDADYLYTAATFRDYAGRPLAPKRNLVRQLLAAHTVHTEPFSDRFADAALAVLEGWMRQKHKADGEADQRACTEAIAHAGAFQLHGFVHFAEGLPIGFMLAQALQPGVFAVRFAKGLDTHKGIYQHMFQHFCREFAQPVAWLNFEQDMGLLGFRRSKLSYRPAALLPKLRIHMR